MRPRLFVRIFIGPYGLRAGWRFLLFVCLAVLLFIGLGAGLHRFGGPIGRYGASLLRSWTGIMAALIATWVMGRIEGGRVWSYGLVAPHRLRNLAVGLVTGMVSLSVLMGLLAIVGAYKPGPPGLDGAQAMLWGSYWGLVFAGVALSEESLTRSYPLFSLSQGIGFLPAAVLLSILFGAGHLGNSGEEWMGIVNAVLVGLVLAYSVKWTGSLWWAVGFHLTWDWGESFLYGVADSGTKSHHHLLSWDPSGAGWLSGGSVGPEGSMLAAPVLLALAAAVRLTTREWKNPGLVRLRRVALPLPLDGPPNPGETPVA